MEKAFQRSFDNLNLDYIDLYLIHSPVAYRRVLKNIRLPSDDVNAFHLFPVGKDGKICWILFYFSIKYFVFVVFAIRKSNDGGCWLLGYMACNGKIGRKRPRPQHRHIEFQQRTNATHSIECENFARHKSSRMPSKFESTQIDWFLCGTKCYDHGIFTVGPAKLAKRQTISLFESASIGIGTKIQQNTGSNSVALHGSFI